MWEAPTAEQLIYSGDGGSQIDEYIIEWDETRFSAVGAPPQDSATVSASAATELGNALSPAARRQVGPALEASRRIVTQASVPAPRGSSQLLSFVIGSRNVSTGNTDSQLVPGNTYAVRVSARNSVGFGPAAHPKPPTATTRDQEPTAPRDFSVRSLNNQQVSAEWAVPLHDGGSTLQYFQLQVDTTEHFNSSDLQRTNLPVVHETQVLSVELNETGIEVQTVEIVEDVRNEI